MSEAARYVHRIRVRYGEVDMQRVAFNAHYLAYCDDAVETWLQHQGVQVTQLGWDFMLVRATVEWQGSATVHDVIDVEVGVDRWGTTSFDVGFVGTVGGEPVFTAGITYVGVEYGTRTPMPPPAEARELMDAPARA